MQENATALDRATYDVLLKDSSKCFYFPQLFITAGETWKKDGGWWQGGLRECYFSLAAKKQQHASFGLIYRSCGRFVQTMSLSFEDQGVFFY